MYKESESIAVARKWSSNGSSETLFLLPIVVWNRKRCWRSYILRLTEGLCVRNVSSAWEQDEAVANLGGLGCPLRSSKLRGVFNL